MKFDPTSVKKIQVSVKFDKKKKSNSQDYFIFIITSRSVLFRITNALEQIFTEYENTNFMFNTFLLKQ